MNQPDTDKVFSGSIPKLYEEYLVPMIFASYAEDVVRRLAAHPATHPAIHPAARVLEIATGTGIVTRRLAAVLPHSISIVATDLNPAMLALAAKTGTSRTVEWQQADAMQLPFGDATFDAVVCQFGAMFFPDKAKAFSEARRVLKPGGVFIFSVWDSIQENEFADTVETALASLFPHDPPRFMGRTPHGYYDLAAIAQDLQAGGFSSSPSIVTVAARSQASSAQVAAIAYCQGTPLRNEIEARGKSQLKPATDIAAQAIAQRFGTGPVNGKIQAHIVTVEC